VGIQRLPQFTAIGKSYIDTAVPTKRAAIPVLKIRGLVKQPFLKQKGKGNPILIRSNGRIPLSQNRR
jgi:hypothetical protein